VPGALFDARRSKVERYADLVVGERGWGALLRYELVTLLASWVPGAVGLVLRGWLYPWLLGACGRNVHLRDERGAPASRQDPDRRRRGHRRWMSCSTPRDRGNRGIDIGSRVFLGRHTLLACKDGDIALEDGVNISYNCTVFSASSVRIGAETCWRPTATWWAAGTISTARICPSCQQARPSQGIVVGRGRLARGRLDRPRRRDGRPERHRGRARGR
jgi:hypothetical protein